MFVALVWDVFGRDPAGITNARLVFLLALSAGDAVQRLPAGEVHSVRTEVPAGHGGARAGQAAEGASVSADLDGLSAPEIVPHFAGRARSVMSSGLLKATVDGDGADRGRHDARGDRRLVVQLDEESVGVHPQ